MTAKPDESAEAFITACELAVRLKRVKRTGWLHRGLAEPVCESVGDHSFGVAFLTLTLLKLIDHDLDEARCLEYALLHDIAEAIVGDITPRDPRAAAKADLEDAAVGDSLAAHPVLEPLAARWREYAERDSAEAKFVKQVDQLELIVQAICYDRNDGLDVTSMIGNARRKVTDERLLRLLDALEASAFPGRFGDPA